MCIIDSPVQMVAITDGLVEPTYGNHKLVLKPLMLALYYFNLGRI